MACTAQSSLRTPVGFDSMSTCSLHEVYPQRTFTSLGSRKGQGAFGSQVQSLQQLYFCQDLEHAQIYRSGARRSTALGSGKLSSARLSQAQQEPGKARGWRFGDDRDTKLGCNSLRLGGFAVFNTEMRTKNLKKSWKLRDGAVSAIVSNSEGVSRRRHRGSSNGLRPAPSESNGCIPGGSSMNRREKLQVAVDVDEVLGFFVATLNDFCEEEYRMQYHVSQYHIYDFKTVWGCSQEEANHRVHAFFGSKHFNQGIPPIPGAIQALLRLQAECHLVVVTSRQHVIRKPTLEWIDVHYPNIFKEVHFGNHYALEGVARPKSEICKSLGVEILIDDNPKYALECAEHGIEVLLFDWNDSYPWSKTDDGPVHPLITRVRDWMEVEEVLLARTSAVEP